MKLEGLLRRAQRPVALLLGFLMLFTVFGCSDLADALELADDVLGVIENEDYATVATQGEDSFEETTEPDSVTPLQEDGSYYTKDEVASYIHCYEKLPSNFITKSEARDLGWDGGSVEVYLDGAAIGGDIFGNREGLLPKKDGRIYYECDIDTLGEDSRGAKRIVYSNDGLIYYTDDHYESFTLLYGDE